ncbi:hypothetical protein HNR60_003600 [Rhodopseudomonas rhenobacensis]|uniref:Uncharacterized protein n=1 Tax=Rhodopseudomonas rhenobacensis TaxID=87461 RepID=A0A7W8E0F9_9BRAD|nr:hypothetical protein [Rhodopseudomonas rhenobacensis]MBB5048830.1 hypothetical protein [Rhodopseudomonas rhenobacensis]
MTKTIKRCDAGAMMAHWQGRGEPVPAPCGEQIGPAARKLIVAVGARVQMSALGRQRHPRYGARQGVVVGRGGPSSWRVKFDDAKTVQSIHKDYLEVVSELAADTATPPAARS